MPVYDYVGMRSADGKRVRGTLDADSERDARQLLRRQEIFATELESRAAPGDVADAGRSFLGSREPALGERIVFTRLLSSLIRAGFPVVEALREVEGQVGGSLGRITMELRNNVSEGMALSEAMARNPRVFPTFYTSQVRAGEASGALATVLGQLATSLEAGRRVREQLISALVYPCIMAVTGLVVVVFLLSVVVPRILILFEGAHQVLPWPTRSMLATGHFLQSWGTSLALVAALAVLGFIPWSRSRLGRLRVERFLFAVPGLRDLLLRVVTLRLAQSLGLLLRNGVSVVDALEVAAESTGYASVREELREAARAVGQGVSLSEALMGSRRISPLALHMVKAGETTGSLGEMLDRIAETFEYEVQRTVERALGLVNPAIVLAMGVVVAYIALAALLPIFEMNQLIR